MASRKKYNCRKRSYNPCKSPSITRNLVNNKGKVVFERDPWRKRKLFYVNVEPQEIPNRYVKHPGYLFKKK